MTKSESIAQLADALSKAQGAIKNAAKDSANPFFKSKYADLASVWDACREPLSANGLSVVQVPEVGERGATVHTLMMHSSGEWICGELTMQPVKDDPQGVGSVITYARRYALSGFAGVAPDDDDGNAASGKQATNEPVKRTFGQPAEATSQAPAKAEALPVIQRREQEPGTATIEQGQASNLHRIFREALKKPLQSKADAILESWLAKKGYIDADGKPTALRIPADLFFEEREEAEAYAKAQ